MQCGVLDPDPQHGNPVMVIDTSERVLHFGDGPVELFHPGVSLDDQLSQHRRDVISSLRNLELLLLDHVGDPELPLHISASLSCMGDKCSRHLQTEPVGERSITEWEYAQAANLRKSAQTS